MSIREKLACAVLGALFGGMLIFCLSLLAEAATLQISGSATGNGTQLLEITGQNITAFFDGFKWNVTGAVRE